MPAKRLAMRHIKEVLRLKWGQGLSQRQIAHSLGISRPAIADDLGRAEQAGLTWPVPETLDETAVEQLLFPARPTPSESDSVVPDWVTIHRELTRKNVTVFLLWQAYKAAEPGGFQYSWFCHGYRRWAGTFDLVMRQNHRAGEKLFVDYAGHTRP